MKTSIQVAIQNFERVRTIGEMEVTLPEPPKWTKIANYDKPKVQQKFTYTPQPNRNEEPTDAFLEQEYQRIQQGYWFFNYGKLEYITGYHYFFLNYWTDRGKQLVFIDAQRDAFLWWDAIEKNPNFAFGILVSNRRFGKTVWGTCITYIRTATRKFQYAGIQSKTNADGKGVFNKLIGSWSKLPEWLKPVDTGETRPASVLEFFESRKRSSKEKKVYGESLDSKIDFKPSSVLGYDGEELDTYFGDEEGKCHTKGTQVLMFDGSYKNVEDVNVGDMLMGDDSKPRTVKKLARGNEKCYNVIPKAKGWYKWGCNESHILSLKYCYGSSKRFKKDKVYNIPIAEFLKITNKDKKHFCLYRNAVDYAKNKLKLDPYFLGVWLGDGSSNTSSITNVEPEITEYLYDVAKKEGLKIRITEGITYHIHSPSRKKGSNTLLSSLQYYNLINNKHIPSDYLFNDRDSRLKLLAGLIDTDGSKSATKDCYEITQKNKILLEQISRLCFELGFKANIQNKVATMKRKDGSVYSCDVYRIAIHGLNLHEIPCKVEKKKIHKKDIKHTNTRDSLRTCFSLEDIGNQDYYGFTISGNHLYMLRDCQVTHNTLDANVAERHEVVVKCLMKASTITGKGLKTTTVEEMEKKGGKNFKKIWDASDIRKVNPKTGRNEALATRLFIPADYGYYGKHPVTGEWFVDDYGYSRRELAKQYILDTWENLEGDALSSAQRKDPLTIKHVWQLKNFDSTFDNELLEIQKDYLERSNPDPEDNAPKNLIRRVTFYRDEGGLVRWRDDAKGYFQMVWDFKHEELSNRRKPHDSGLWQPGNVDNFAIGVDPFAATITTGTEKSMGVAYVYKKGDANDPENSGFCVVRYAQRTRYKGDFHANIMLLCQYFGCKANYESNVDDYYEDFIRNGFKHYVMWRPKCTIDPMRKNVKVKYGTPSNDGFALQKQTIIADEYIKRRYHKIYFIELVNQLINFDPDNRTKFDDAIAFFMALIGGVEGNGKPTQETKPMKMLVIKKSKKYY